MESYLSKELQRLELTNEPADDYEKIARKNEMHDSPKIWKPRENSEQRLALTRNCKNDEVHTLAGKQNYSKVFLKGQESDILRKLHMSAEAIVGHFERCKQIIEKLHSDRVQTERNRDTVMEKFRTAHVMIQASLPSLPSLPQTEVVDETEEDGSRPTTPDEVELIPSPIELDETDMILLSIQDRLENSEEIQRAREAEMRECNNILENIFKLIKERKLMLPSQPNLGARTQSMPYDQEDSTVGDRLPSKLLLIQEELDFFTNKDKQMNSNASAATPFNKSDDKVAKIHRNFDQIDFDLMQLLRELKRTDIKDRLEVVRSMAFKLAEETRTEREDCIRIISDLHTSVSVRRQTIEQIRQAELLSKKLSKRKNRSIVGLKKTRVIVNPQSVESNFYDRLLALSHRCQTLFGIRFGDAGQNKGGTVAEEARFPSEDLRMAEQTEDPGETSQGRRIQKRSIQAAVGGKKWTGSVERCR